MKIITVTAFFDPMEYTREDIVAEYQNAEAEARYYGLFIAHAETEQMHFSIQVIDHKEVRNNEGKFRSVVSERLARRASNYGIITKSHEE